MDLTLDCNIELFPLKANESVTVALASSLARGPPNTNEAGEEEKEFDVWRPDGKGRRGLEDEFEYVMYGKVGGGRIVLCRYRWMCPFSIVGSCYSKGVQIRRWNITNCVRLSILHQFSIWLI